MTYFEYAAIYFGIIVGLALADILNSLHKLIAAGSRVRWGFLAPLSAFYAATFTLGEFWYVWSHQSVGHRIFLTWLPLAAAFALLFLMCAASLPDDASEPDLDRYYFDNRHRFWGFSVALHALNLASWTVTLSGQGFAPAALQAAAVPLLANGTEAALSLSLVFTRAKWWHLLAMTGLWLYTLSFFGPMRLT